MMKKALRYGAALGTLVTLVLFGVYWNQDWLIMRFNPLPQNHVYRFADPHEELFFQASDGATINALIFPVENAKGVVLYIHGRGGNLDKPWGKVNREFTKRGYTTLIFDYRGFGKSIGPLNQASFLSDACTAYDYLAERYPDKKIFVYGVSFGSGIAVHTASLRHPYGLILEAPYYSMLDLIPRMGYLIPQTVLKCILKYPLPTHQWIQNVRCPIYIFHGQKDELIPYNSSERLLSHVPSEVEATLITLKNGKHNYLSKDRLYQETLDRILE